MSERVQFIFITHNKATMEAALSCCGVTMSEPGVSRLVPVDVEEAAKLAVLPSRRTLDGTGLVLSATELRVIVAVVGVLVLALIYFFGRPRKPGQGRRGARRRRRARAHRADHRPRHGEPRRASSTSRPRELERLGQGHRRETRALVGRHQAGSQDRTIVTLFVAARPGENIAGSDVVVAAEKAGMQFGDMGIFHRLARARPKKARSSAWPTWSSPAAST